MGAQGCSRHVCLFLYIFAVFIHVQIVSDCILLLGNKLYVLTWFLLFVLPDCITC